MLLISALCHIFQSAVPGVVEGPASKSFVFWPQFEPLSTQHYAQGNKPLREDHSNSIPRISAANLNLAGGSAEERDMIVQQQYSHRPPWCVRACFCVRWCVSRPCVREAQPFAPGILE